MESLTTGKTFGRSLSPTLSLNLGRRQDSHVWFRNINFKSKIVYIIHAVTLYYCELDFLVFFFSCGLCELYVCWLCLCGFVSFLLRFQKVGSCWNLKMVSKKKIFLRKKNTEKKIFFCYYSYELWLNCQRNTESKISIISATLNLKS